MLLYDPELTIEKYERTEEQNQKLGLTEKPV